MSEKTEEEIVAEQELADKLEAEKLKAEKVDDDPEEELSVEELKQQLSDSNAKLEESNSSKARVEKESRDWKKKFQGSKRKEELEEDERLKKNGKTQELLDRSEQKNQDLKDQLVKTTSSTLRDKLENMILKLNPNVVDVDWCIHSLDKELYEIDADAMTITGVSDALADVMKRKPHLFGKKGMPNSSDTNPKPMGGSTKVTYEKWLSLPYKEKKEKMHAGLVEGLPDRKTG